ncbi:Unc-112-related protein [Zootermopsis nevadensis]|uniref:Unc-112-related protein n=1 Tax=Zootermopsis nevadensis TaxID=136037 RepID=A0A067QK43_ZOONE|nr:Unc-112-related protein [Zootermopsis nevadensis]
MMADGYLVGDGSWDLRVYVTDLQVERTLRVKGDLHIGGVMLKLVEDLGNVCEKGPLVLARDECIIKRENNAITLYVALLEQSTDRLAERLSTSEGLCSKGLLTIRCLTFNLGIEPTTGRTSARLHGATTPEDVSESNRRSGVLSAALADFSQSGGLLLDKASPHRPHKVEEGHSLIWMREAVPAQVHILTEPFSAWGCLLLRTEFPSQFNESLQLHRNGGFGDVEWINLAEDSVLWWDVVNFRVPCKDFFHRLFFKITTFRRLVLSPSSDTGLESLCRKLPSLKVVDNLAQVGELVKQQRRGRFLATSERNTNKPIAVSYDGECIPKELSVVKCCSHVHKASIVLVRLDRPDSFAWGIHDGCHASRQVGVSPLDVT